jgi:AAA+ ATPase superfamily predicted ATPase
MVGASPDLPSILQECWDRHWKKTGKLLLILCGSYVGFMEREVLGKTSPLFGRRTAQILLRPFAYGEAAEFHPGWSLADRARAYFVCGGVPLYLRMFEPGRSIEQNIEATLLDEFAPLHREPDFLLREELRDVTNYYTVLRAIAAGSIRGRDIADESGIAERSLHYYIQQLSDLGYVGRAHPLVGKKPLVRNVRYTIEDPLLRFWFRFVFPNSSFNQRRGAHATIRERIRPELEAYFGHCFERLCREALPALYQREKVGAAFEVGEYWDKRVQLDVVGFRDDRWTDLGECKWGTAAGRPDPVAELRDKAQLYPNRRGATLGLRVFTRERPKPSQVPPEIRWHALPDLYGDG